LSPFLGAFVFSCLLLFAAAASSLAQPTRIDPALALSDAREAYRAGSVADHVRLTIRPAGRATFREDFIVRTAPQSADPARPAAVLLELGDLRVYASGGTLTAASQRSHVSFFQAQYAAPPPAPPDAATPAALAPILPPLCLPQLALAFSAEDPVTTSIADFTAYTPRITFTSATADEKGGLVALTGQSHPPHGSAAPAPVALVIDARTGRLRRFETRLAPDGAGGAGAPEGASGDTTLLLEFAPLEPGDPAAWAIDTAGRTRVEILSDLRPQPGDILRGRNVPDFTLADLKSQPWSTAAALAAPAGPGLSPPTHVAILFVRDAEADPHALPAARRALAGLPAHVVTRTALILPRAGADTMQRLRAAVARAGLGDDPLWSASPETTIDRFLPAAPLGIIVVRADRTLACAIALEAHATDEAAIRARLDDCLAPPP
jgi:hypothetical protein